MAIRKPSKRKVRNGAQPPRIAGGMALALEPRFLFDAAGVTTAVDPAHSDAGALPTDTAHTADSALAKAICEARAPAADVPAAPTSAPVDRRELIVIDPSVANVQQLVQSTSPSAQILVLDSRRDGLQQIAEALQGQTGVSAVHILSHGASGELTLGNKAVTSETLETHAADLGTIRNALTADADILLYGCDVGAGGAGVAFVGRLAELTGADVAASSDSTGAAEHGGNWVLETSAGPIKTPLVGSESARAEFHGLLGTLLSGSANWVPLMGSSTNDPIGDSQAKAADTDLVGDGTHAVLYGAYDDNGTPNDTRDDFMAFRIRIDNPTSSSYFGGVAVVGMDANHDGRVDIFMAVDGRNNTQAVRLFDPGTGLNNSPNTTTTSPLPIGWLPNNGVYGFTASNYSVAAVSSANDPQWDGTTDFGHDGKVDVFVSYRIPIADIATVLAKASPVDRNGVVGPRGTTGIAGFNKDTSVAYVLMTETQPGPLNGDLAGVGSNYDRNATFTSLGAFTATMTPSNPVASGQSVTINRAIGDGNLSAGEDGAVLIRGTVGGQTPNGAWVKVTITDSANHSITDYTQVGGGSWQVTKDLSSLGDGTLSVTAELWTNSTGSGTHVAGSVGDATAVLHDRTPPVVTVSPLTTAGRPTISGTADLPVGSTITVTVDPNGDGVLTDAVIYKAIVLSGGMWSVDTATAAPFSGTVAAGGFLSYATIKASGTDSAGNITNTVAIDRPIVNALTTNSLTPTISGVWGGSNGGTDSLSVSVNNVTYTTSNGLVISGNSWAVTLSGNTGVTALVAGNSYDVVATVTRTSPAGSTTDTTTSELSIVSGPSVDIGGNGIGTAGTASLSKPVIAGTATPGAVVVLVIDLDNDSNTTNDRVTYSAVANGSSAWSIDTATTVPMSGTFPAAGLSGTVGLTATVTDSNGRTAVDTQALTITVPSISIAGVSGALPASTGTAADGILNGTEDDAAVVLISATNVPTSQTIAVTIGDGVHTVTGTASYDATSLKWKATLDLSTLNDGTSNLTVAASYNNGQATASTTVSHDSEAYATVTSAETTSANPTITGTADATSASLVIKVETYKSNQGAISLSNTAYYSVSGGTVGGYTTTSGVTFTNGAWSLAVSQSGGTFNQSGENLKITVLGTDAAGNAVNATGQVTKIGNSATPATVAINTIAGDNIINSAEDTALTVSGTTNISGGPILVTLTDGTHSISQEVTASGTNWSLANLNLSGWKSGPILVEAKLLSAAGSTVVRAEASATPTHTITSATPPTIAITSPIGDGNLSASEDSSVTVTGTTTNAIGSTVTVTISDGSVTKTGTATVAANGTWTATFDAAHSNLVSALADGTLQVSAAVTANGSTANATASVLHDRTAPALEITPLLTKGTPVIAGTSDLAAGSTVTVTIDPDNVSGSATPVTYQATVQSGGAWSVDLSSATPTSGSLPMGGLTDHARITATGQDAAGNGTTVTGLDKPTVNALLTNSTTPTVTGGWANTGSATLYVVINGKAYAATAGQSVTLGGIAYTTVSGLSVSGDSWSVTTQALPAGTYEVKAYATGGGLQALDATSSELVVDTTAPSVTISGISTDSGSSTTDFVTNDTTLVFSGAAEANANVLVTLKDASGATVFSTTVVAAGGVWSVDRSGQAGLADGTYTLTATATDAAGNSGTATKAVVVDTSATIAVTNNFKVTSASPVITGSSDLEAGRSVDVTVNGATYSVQVQSGGGWSLDLSSATPTSGTKNPLVDGQSYTVSATGTDLAGNTATGTKTIQVDTSAPKVSIAGPLDWNGNANGTLTLSEDKTVVIKGTTAKGASSTALAGGQIAVLITDGTTTLSDTATVQSDGTWTLSAFNLRGLNSGTITVTATYVDAGGTSYSDIATVLHDKSGPVSIDSVSTDTGAPGDFVTADQTLLFKGTATAGQTVTVTLTNSANAVVFSGPVVAGADGVWTYDNQGNTLANGSYTLSATCNGTTVTQAVTVDAAPPAGPVTVASLSASSVTPTITGTATVGAGETLSVTVNGKTYTAGDGKLSLSGTSWTLTIPTSDALTPASADQGFNGVYSVTATIRDAAGNVLDDTTNNELTIADTTKPVIDLDTTATGVNRAVTSIAGAAVSLDNNAAAATLVEASKVQNVSITVGGLKDGISEKLLFGQTALAADGSGGARTGVLVGGVSVNITYASNTFSIVKSDWTTMTAAEGQAIIRDIQYQNTLAGGSTAGQRTFAFKALDDAGNLSDPATATVSVTGDIATPTITSATDDVAPVTGALTGGARTNDTAPLLNGTLTGPLNSGEVLAIYRDGTKINNATVTGTSWTYQDSGLVDGTTYSYTARAENGTVLGTASASFALTVDTTAPAAPTLALTSTSDSGASSSDRITAVTTPTVRVTFTGTGSALPGVGDVVKVYSGGNQVGTATLVANDLSAGFVDVTTSSLGADGTKSLTADITDTAGNAGSASSALSVTLDTTAPTIMGASISGNTLVLTYTEAGSLDATNPPAAGAFTVQVNGTTVAVNAVGVDATNKTVTLTLASAVTVGQTVTVSYADPTGGNDANAVQDVAGNDAASVPTQTATNGTGNPAPTAGTVTAADVGQSDKAGTSYSFTIAYSDSDGTINAASIGTGNVTVTGPGGGTLAVTGATWSNGVATYTVTPPDGSWNDADNGTYTIAINAGKVKDNNGSVVAANSSAKTFTVSMDTTAPLAPTVALQADTGGSTSDKITKDGTPSVGGVEANATIEYSTDGTSWSTSAPNATQGSNTVYVRQVDAAGNTSSSASLTFTLDTATPSVSSATVVGNTLVLTYSDASTLDAANKAATSDFAVTVAGQTVAVTSVAVDASAGTVTLTLASAALNNQTVTVTYTDPSTSDDPSATQDIAGNDAATYSNSVVTNNTGIATPTQTVTITKAVDDVTPVTGDLTSGARTNDTAPELSGTLSSVLTGSQVLRVYRNGSSIGAATVNGTNWTYTDNSSSLSNGQTYTYTARVEEGTARGTASSSFALVIDTQAPSAPTLSLQTDSGASPTDKNSASGTLTTGNVEAGATVEYSANGTTWSTMAPTAAEGSNTVYVRQTDQAGNVSQTGSLTFTLDTTAPAVSSAVVDGASLVLTYTEANSLDAANPAAAGRFTVTVDGQSVTVNSVSVDAAAKKVTLTLATPVTYGQVIKVGYTDPSGNNDVAAIQDLAGNDAATFADLSVTNDTASTGQPTAPTVAAIAATSGTPTVTGTWGGANGGTDTLSVTINGKTYTAGQGLTINGMSWSVVIPTADRLADGTYEVTATASRQAGGQAGDTSANELRVDTTAPATPGLSLPGTYDTGVSSTDRLTATPTVRVTFAGTGATAPVANDVATVYLGGTAVGTASIAQSNITAGYIDVTLTGVGADDLKTLTARISDTTGNASAASAPLVVALDRGAPQIAGAIANGTLLTLSYADASPLDSVNKAPAGAFTVTVDGRPVAVNAVNVDPGQKTVTLTLASGVGFNQAVTVAYTDPGAQTSAATRDAAGNHAVSFATRAAVNVTPTPDAPRTDDTPTVTTPVVTTPPVVTPTTPVVTPPIVTPPVVTPPVVPNTPVVTPPTVPVQPPVVTPTTAVTPPPPVTPPSTPVVSSTPAVLTVVQGPATTPPGTVATPTAPLISVISSLTPVTPAAPTVAVTPAVTPASQPPAVTPPSPGVAPATTPTNGPNVPSPTTGTLGNPLGDGGSRPNSLPPPVVLAPSGSSSGPTLQVVGTVGDRTISPGQPSNIPIPVGTFQSTDPQAQVMLEATQSDGSPLPTWLKFDASSGTFTGSPPPDLQTAVNIKVIARDNQGAQAVTEFRIAVGQNTSVEGSEGAATPTQQRTPAGQDNTAPDQPAPDQAAPPAEPAQQPPPERRADAGTPGPVGKPPLSRQLHAAVDGGAAAEFEALWNSLKALVA